MSLSMQNEQLCLYIVHIVFTSQPEKAFIYCFYPWHPAGQVGGHMVGQAVGKSCPDQISGTLWGRVLIFMMDID